MDNNLFFFETSGFSMWPFVKSGEKLVIKKVPAEGLKTGDIILYKTDNQLVCHRLVKKTRGKQGYLLYSRGDSSRSFPEPVAEDMYLGKAIGILRNGRILDLTKRRQNFFNQVIVLVGPIVGLLARIIRPLYAGLKKPRRLS